MKAAWKTTTLANICQMYQPKTISAKEMVADGPYRVYGANGVIGRYHRFNHEEPQLLITCRGATCGAVNISEPHSWITGNAMVVRPQDGSIEMRFLEYLFRGGIDISKVVTGAAQPQITRTNLAPLQISYPQSLDEQRRIVAILDKAFAAIAAAKANTEKNLQNARALFESHLQSVFTQHGSGWVEKTLGEIAVFRNGMNFTKDSRGDSVRIVGVKDFQRSFWVPFDNLETVVIDGELPETDELKSGDILTVRSNGNIELIGRCLLAGRVPFKVSHSGFTIRIRLTAHTVAPAFLCHFLKSAGTRRRLIEGGTGTNIKSLNQGMLAALLIPIPPIPDQHRAVELLDELAAATQDLSSLYSRKLAALDELKKSLLHQAFTGQL